MVSSANSEVAAELYRTLDQTGIAIWIDRGRVVDAVAGRQTRSHNDLDLAVEAKALDALRQFLKDRGYRQTRSMEASQWNVVFDDGAGRTIDVHVVVLDEHGGVWTDPVDGVAYPACSLTGEGIIDGATVRCVRPDCLLQLNTSYPPRAVDRQEIAVLCCVRGRPAPGTHK